MEFNILAFMELFVVFAFVAGWAIIELVSLRYDKKRKQREERESNTPNSTDRPRHPEG